MRAKMNDVAVSAENLSKRYRIGEKVPYKALRDEITKLFTTPFGKLKNQSAPKREKGYIWALKDVSLEVKRGEVVGIIGRNGAGKTTLLKILSRVTEPTKGHAEIRGRVGSLLEVGTGFHPELTGRENIYLNGAILGMKKREIDKKFNEIVSFAEIEKFIDTPVKHYSAGMHVRLAFAVAAHLEPEILLVDEVLAVGDVEFQKKCLGKMKDVTGEGRTVLFVSHNMAVIQALCPQTLLLEQGCLQMRGSSAEVVKTYLKGNSVESGEYIWQWEEERLNDLGLLVPLSLRILDHKGKVSERVLARYPFQIEFRYQLTESVSNLRVGLTLKTTEGQWVCTSFDRDRTEEHGWYNRKQGIYVAMCTIPENLLNDGTFVLGVITGIKGAQRLYRDFELIRFSVDMTAGVGSHWADGRSGVIRPDFKWETEFAG